jgi:putative lipoic acid-binding regulatory protein
MQHIPLPDESLIQFPADVPVTAIGMRVDHLANSIAETVRAVMPDFDPTTIELRASKAKTYLAVAFTVRFENKEQMHAVDAALRANPLVKVVL